MLNVRSLLLAFALTAVVGLSASTSQANAALQVSASRPYAPELFDRAALTTNDNEDEEEEGLLSKRRRSVHGEQPYSPDLYFRSSLLSEDEQREQTPTLTKRTPGAVCRRDGDCASSHYCGHDATCYMRMAKRGVLCKRDAMCSSSMFCGAQGACLTKRSIGSTCAEGSSSCAQGLFCSTVDTKCKQKRTLNEACRTTDGCAEGLACLNFKCKASLLQQKAESVQDQLEDAINKLAQGHFPPGPWPSGSFFKPIKFGSRDSAEKRTFFPFPPSPSGFPFPHHLQQLKDAYGDAVEEGKEKLEDFFDQFVDDERK